MSRRCRECASALAEDQRYCVACGAPSELGRAAARGSLSEPASAAAAATAPPGAAPRGATEPPPGPALRGATAPPRLIVLRLFGRYGHVRLPSRRSTLVLACGMLAAGLLIGVAVGPVAIDSSATAAGRQIIALVLGRSPTSSTVRLPAATASPAPTDSLTSSFTAATSSPLSPSPAPVAAPPVASVVTPPAPAAAAPTTPAYSNATGAATPLATPITTPPPTPTPARRPSTATVVAQDTAAQSLYVVDTSDNLYEVHTGTSVPVGTGTGTGSSTGSSTGNGTGTEPGTKVRLVTEKLANGTVKSSSLVSDKGESTASVRVKGYVSFVDPARGLYALSSRGASLLISTTAPSSSALDPAGQPSSSLPAGLVALGQTTTSPTPATTTTTSPTSTTAAPGPPTPGPPPRTTPTATMTPLPSIGQTLQIKLRLPCPGATGGQAMLHEEQRTVTGVTRPPLELAGLLSAIDKQRRIVTLSADGAGTRNETISLTVPTSIDLTKLKVPEVLVIHARVALDGSYTLTGSAADTDAAAADDPRGALGDFSAVRQARPARRNPISANRRPSPVRQVRQPSRGGPPEKSSGRGS